MANGRLSFSLRDYSKENSGFTIHTGAVTAISLPGLLTQIGNFRTAMDAVTDGVIAKEKLTAFDSNLSVAVPSDPTAHRERKWLVRYRDNQPFFDDPINAIPNEAFGETFWFTMPTAKFTADTLLPNSDLADLTDPLWTAFITAYQAIARSPAGGTVTVYEIEAVGRNT